MEIGKAITQDGRPDGYETGVATTFDGPVNKPVTVVKFDIYRKKVSVFTGTVLDGPALYEDFDNIICRNKVVVQFDDPEKCYLLPSDPEEGLFRDWFGVFWFGVSSCCRSSHDRDLPIQLAARTHRAQFRHLRQCDDLLRQGSRRVSATGGRRGGRFLL